MDLRRSVSLCVRTVARAAQALRAALREMRRRPGSTLLAVSVLAIAMTGAVIAYSIADALVLRPLPFAEPERLFSISAPSRQPDWTSPVTGRSVSEWTSSNTALESIAALRIQRPAALEDSQAELIGWLATPSLFSVLGIHPVVGEFFTDRSTSEEIVLSHRAWERYFRADPAVVGRAVRLGGVTRTIKGVLPRRVRFPLELFNPPDFYIAHRLTAQEEANDRAMSWVVVGRTKPGVQEADLVRDLGRLAPVVVRSLPMRSAAAARGWSLLATTASAVLLLLAAVNVAGLRLTRAISRLNEFAVKLALGASRGHIAAALIVEGLLIAAIATVLAMSMAHLSLEWIREALPRHVNRAEEIVVNGRIAIAASVAALSTGALIGALPLLFLGSRLYEGMKGTSGGSVGSRRQRWELAGLVVAQVSMATVLLVAAALVTVTFYKVSTANLGFDWSHIVRMDYVKSLAKVPAPQHAAAENAIRSSIIAEVSSMPGISAFAMMVGSHPLGAGLSEMSIERPGSNSAGTPTFAQNLHVSDTYFALLGIPRVSGRLFNENDTYGAPRVAILSASLAAELFPMTNPIGRTIVANKPVEVVGVVSDVRMAGIETSRPPQIYFPLSQFSMGIGQTFGAVLLKTTAPNADISQSLRQLLRPFSDDEPRPMIVLADDFARITETRRVNAQVGIGFSASAVLVVALGIFGTLTFEVQRNVRTIGIRKALGSTDNAILRWTAVRAGTPVCLGLLLGIFVAWVSSSSLGAYAFGVSASSYWIYLAVALFMLVVSALAIVLPARIAYRVSPSVALRHQ